MKPFTYRILTANDAEAYRKIRTEALTGDDRRFFTTDPQKELSRTHEEWRTACSETCTHATIGAFTENNIAGTVTVKKIEEKTAKYIAGYVCPAYRHSAIVQTIFSMLDLWAAEHGCDKAILTIRADHNRWLEAQCKYGAVVSGQTKAIFADGIEAPIVILERPLMAAMSCASCRAG